MNWKNTDHRSVLLLQVVIVSLFFPIPVSSISIILFLLHSFSNRQFVVNVKSHPHRSWVWLSVLFFAVNAASLAYTDSMEEGLRRLETMQPFLWLPLCIASIDYTFLKSGRGKLLNTFFFASIAAALIALGTALFYVIDTGSLYKTITDDGVEVKEYYFTYLRLSRIIMHPGYLSVYMGMAIYLGFDLIRSGHAWIRSKTVGYALLGFLLIFLFMLQGRMNLLAFAIITFSTFLLYLFRRSKPARALAYGTGILALLALLFMVLPKDVTRRFTEFKSLNYNISAPVIHQFNGLTLRLAEWTCAWDVIEESPITGVGLGDAKEQLLESYRQNNFVVGLRRKFNCHNQYLESWLAAGLPALILLMCLLFYALTLAYRRKDGILAMLILYFFMSMLTESMLIRHKAVTLFNVLLPVLVFTAGWEHKKHSIKKAEK
ncbi:MAG: O-antigen ligase family protein [Owenweeksia sp.]